MSDRHQSLRDRRPHTSSSAYADFHGLTSMAGWMVLVCMKDAEILRDQFLILQDVAGVAGEHAAAGVEDDCLIRYVERQMVRPTSATISGARPSDGSSSRRTRGFPISARPIASICSSPPESVPAICAWRSRSRGNIV